MRNLSIIITFLLILSSCSRKVVLNKSQSTDKTTIISSDKTNDKIDTKTDTNIIFESDELEIEPIDNTKPLTINGKSYFNARIKAVKSKSITNIKEDKKEAKTGLKTTKKKNNIKKVGKAKQTDKQDYSMVYIMGVAILLISGYLYFKFK